MAHDLEPLRRLEAALPGVVSRWCRSGVRCVQRAQPSLPTDLWQMYVDIWEIRRVLTEWIEYDAQTRKTLFKDFKVQIHDAKHAKDAKVSFPACLHGLQRVLQPMNPSLLALVSSMPWAPGPSRANAEEYGGAETCTLVKRRKIACHL